MIRKLLLASLMTFTASSVFASGQTWDFGNVTNPVYQNGNSISLQVDGISLTATAWASTGESCVPYSQGYGSNPSGDPDPCIKSANLRKYGGGLGIINQDEQNLGYGDIHRNNHLNDLAGQHAIDNIQNRAGYGYHGDPDYDHEMVLLTFSESINITEISKGWYHNDADFSTLAYTGSNFSSIEDQTWGSLVATGGWDTVDNGALRQSGVLHSAGVFSKYWLVGAYNSIFGGHHSDYNDAFKFSGLHTIKQPDDTTDNTTNVSAPATFGMLGFLIATLFLRNRRKV